MVLGLHGPLLAVSLMAAKTDRTSRLGLTPPVKVMGIEVGCNGRFLLSVAAFYALCLSVFSAHQEYRFLLPCLPVLHVVLGSAMHSLTARLG